MKLILHSDRTDRFDHCSVRYHRPHALPGHCTFSLMLKERQLTLLSAFRASPDLQPAPLEAVHELIDVKPQFPRRMEVRKWRRCWH